jgi:hypothetical protein
MLYKDDEFVNDRNDHSKPQNKPNAYRIDDGDNVEEKDLERSFLFGGNETRPVMEGKPMGGENFGENNLTPAGDDKNNPSRNAGYTNKYFARTEPSEEHPEDTNFKPLEQEGWSDYSKAMSKEKGDNIGNGDKPKPQQGYQEGTADDDGHGNAKPNIPGPREVPDQQKVGEDDDEDKYHVET